MSDGIDHSLPAFPHAYEPAAAGDEGVAHGMTLRQYYIGQILSAMQIPPSADLHAATRIAQTARRVADEVMRELGA